MSRTRLSPVTTLKSNTHTTRHAVKKHECFIERRIENTFVLITECEALRKSMDATSWRPKR